MALLSKDTTIFFLKNAGLEVYDQVNASRKVIAFSTAEVQHLEIVDKPAFEKKLRDFLQQLNTKEAIILLSSDILFTATLPLTSLEKEEDTIKSFFEQIPLDEERVAKKVLVGKQISCIAVNNDYHLSLKLIAEQFGIKITAVLPVVIFS